MAGQMDKSKESVTMGIANLTEDQPAASCRASALADQYAKLDVYKRQGLGLDARKLLNLML